MYISERICIQEICTQEFVHLSLYLFNVKGAVQVFRRGEKVAEHVASEGGLDAIDAVRRVIKKVLSETPSTAAS
jgi:hypothetical protein